MDPTGWVTPIPSYAVHKSPDEMTRTEIFSLDDDAAPAKALENIAAGELVIIPTETIYGLTTDAENSSAVEKLFALKGRSADKKSAVFLSSVASITRWAEVEYEYAENVIRQFLPGPLTVVLKSKVRDLPGIVSDEGKIGIRVSSHPLIEFLTQALGKPLIATSANLSRGKEVLSTDEVISTFRGKVPLIVTGEISERAQASTVVDLSGTRPVLLREGTIPFAEVLKSLERNE